MCLDISTINVKRNHYLNDRMVKISVSQGTEWTFYSVKKSKNRYLFTKLTTAEYIYRTTKNIKGSHEIH